MDHPLPLVALLFASMTIAMLSGCVNFGKASITQEIESVVAGEVNDSTYRSVRIHCTGKDTILTLGKSEIVFEGYRGYRGRYGTRAGDLQVGTARVSYEQNSITINGPQSQGAYTLHDWMVLQVDQSGAVRSVGGTPEKSK